jgi:hypothetical protein
LDENFKPRDVLSLADFLELDMYSLLGELRFPAFPLGAMVSGPEMNILILEAPDIGVPATIFT